MKNKKHIFTLFIAFCSVGMIFYACSASQVSQALSTVSSVLDTNSTSAEAPLTSAQIISGLKSALEVGAGNSVNIVSKANGFLDDSLIKIPFPPEAIKVKNKVEALGMTEQVNKFVATMNHGAEQATQKAAPIFVNAIKNMTITDGLNILKGSDTAATHYLREKTTKQLIAAFEPDVHNALQAVQLTKYWSPIVDTYNKIPFVSKVNPDLDAYVTQRAVNGLFSKLKIQEKDIRKNPAARVNDILKKVFGYFERNPGRSN